MKQAKTGKSKKSCDKATQFKITSDKAGDTAKAETDKPKGKPSKQAGAQKGEDKLDLSFSCLAAL